MLVESFIASVGGNVVGMVGGILSSIFANRHEETKLKAKTQQLEAKAKIIETTGNVEHAIKLLELIGADTSEAYKDRKSAREADVAVLNKLDPKSWILGWNASLRPFIATCTYLLYLTAKGFIIYFSFGSGLGLLELANVIMSPADYGILGSIVGFYFAKRVFSKVNKSSGNQ